MKSENENEFLYTVYEYNKKCDTPHYIGCRFYSSYTGEECPDHLDIVAHCKTEGEVQTLLKKAPQDSLLAHQIEMSNVMMKMYNLNFGFKMDED